MLEANTEIRSRCKPKLGNLKPDLWPQQCLGTGFGLMRKHLLSIFSNAEFSRVLHTPVQESREQSPVEPISNLQPICRNATKTSDAYVSTHRPHNSSFLGLPYRILHMNPQKGTTMAPMGNAWKDVNWEL